jgi:Predicted rRNA methylase (SpoU class)
MRLALFEPDIPQNLGAFIRLAACLGVPLESSSRAASRSTTSASAVQPWTITTSPQSPATIRGMPSSATGRPAGWCC